MLRGYDETPEESTLLKLLIVFDKYEVFYAGSSKKDFTVIR